MSKLFEYKPTRRDSNLSFFKCLASKKDSANNINLDSDQPLTVSQKFRIEYPPVGLPPFDDVQTRGNQVGIIAVRGEEASININFKAEPPPRKG